MKAIDSAYLPTISPTVDGRIFISDEMVELPVMSSNMSCSSFHSMYSDRTITLPRRGERRTSMVHPIPVRRTITNLTDNQFSHETQDDILEAMSNSSFNRLPPHKVLTPPPDPPPPSGPIRIAAWPSHCVRAVLTDSFSFFLILLRTAPEGIFPQAPTAVGYRGFCTAEA